REDGDADSVRILLDRGLDDLLRGLVQTGVDHLHPRVAERSCDDLRAAVMTVEPGLRDDNADLPAHGRQVYDGADHRDRILPTVAESRRRPFRLPLRERRWRLSARRLRPRGAAAPP